MLFADVSGFTALSERLDPEDVHGIMDRCFRILADEVHRYEGTINQYTGDGIMALFGAPIAHEDAPERAVRAALGMQASLKRFGDELRAERGIDFQMRIGINSGPVVVGKIGDDLRMDYTAVGDTTNLAARLQATAPPGGILISETTAKLVAGRFVTEPVGPLHAERQVRAGNGAGRGACATAHAAGGAVRTRADAAHRSHQRGDGARDRVQPRPRRARPDRLRGRRSGYRQVAPDLRVSPPPRRPGGDLAARPLHLLRPRHSVPADHRCAQERLRHRRGRRRAARSSPRLRKASSRSERT